MRWVNGSCWNTTSRTSVSSTASYTSPGARDRIQSRINTHRYDEGWNFRIFSGRVGTVKFCTFTLNAE